jgi:hypothetical protein
MRKLAVLVGIAVAGVLYLAQPSGAGWEIENAGTDGWEIFGTDGFTW